MPNAPFSTAPPQDVGRGKPHAERGCAGEGAEFALPVPERLRTEFVCCVDTHYLERVGPPVVLALGVPWAGPGRLPVSATG